MTLGTTTTQAYGEAWYWDNRYREEGGSGGGPFDWYQKYKSLAPLLHLYIPPPRNLPILVVGCGNSDLYRLESRPHQPTVRLSSDKFAFSEGMIDDGYGDVVNVDISSVVIEAMQKKFSNSLQLKYIKMDVRDMSAFQTDSFDAVVDKVRTEFKAKCWQDARGGWKLMKNFRVLKDRGVYILITYGAPIYRLRLLRESCSWTVKLHVIDKHASEESSGHQLRELTSSVPLDGDGSSVEEVLGKNSDVHYIYVCIKA